MQSVSAAFSAEEVDSVRKIAHNLQVSWKKATTLGNITFTIGVSTVGGGDVIGLNPGAIGNPGIYKYFDESDYVTSLSWERQLNLPVGGLTKALADITLDNTSGRFTPNFMGGNSELFTAIEPGKPLVIGAGFNFDGIDQTIPQFSGRVTRQPQVDKAQGQVSLHAEDYISYFENKYVDEVTMFTGVSTDVALESIFSQLGMSTAQYDLDPGINTIPFAIFNVGDKFSDIVDQLVAAENGRLYQDETGILRFENRQHWDDPSMDSILKTISTSQVINQQVPDDDHIINIVEVQSSYRAKQPFQPVINWAGAERVEAGETVEKFYEFADPVLEITTPTVGGANSYYKANSLEDGSGSDVSSSLSLIEVYTFATSVKIQFTNTSGSGLYLTEVVIEGRPAPIVGEVNYRDKDSSSITAYEEKIYSINNPYISNSDWAASLATLILNDFGTPENLQIITIRAIPELQFGDYISWQGLYWRVFGITSKLDPSNGFTQELTLVKRAIKTFFRIGISTIGGTDGIAA